MAGEAAAPVSAAEFLAWIRAFARLVEENRELLTELDAAVGDADHGANMHRGMSAAVPAAEGGTGAGDGAAAAPGALVKKVGMTLVSTVGGASGPLYGTFFLRLGTALGDAPGVPPDQVAAALRAGVDGVVARGRAEAGDKTMYDALAPAVAACEEALAAGEPWAEALQRAASAARAGRDATAAMVARKGRASYLGERSVGHQDPGATSAALLVEAAAETLAGPSSSAGGGR
jgi:dihydroxyacetone kinase-like protein